MTNTHALAPKGEAIVADNAPLPLSAPVKTEVWTSANEQAATLNRALLQTSAEGIQLLDRAGVLALQSVLQHGELYGYWQTPRSWDPTAANVLLNIPLRKRIVHFLPDTTKSLVLETDERPVEGVIGHSTIVIRSILDEAVLSLTRYLLLLRMGPSGLGSKGNGLSLDPSTITDIGYVNLPRLLAIGVSKRLNSALLEPDESSHDASMLLGHIEASDLERMPPRMNRDILVEIKRMQVLARRGYWTDIPKFGEELQVVTPVAGAALETSTEEKRDSHLPLPDDYVSEMGQKSLWLIQDLGPNLLSIAKAMQAIWESTLEPTLTPAGVRARRDKQLGTFLNAYVWRDSAGNVIHAPPFQLRLNQFGKNANVKRLAKQAASEIAATEEALEELELHNVDNSSVVLNLNWPPRKFNEIMGLMRNLQMAHMFVVGLSTGARKSELLDLNRSCVEYSVNGMPYASGRTYKLVQRVDGELRDWVLPDLAVQSLEQQVQLVSIAETIDLIEPDGNGRNDGSPQHLWARLGRGGSDRMLPLLGLGTALNSYAKTLGMSTKPGGQNLRPHRLRKTVARMVALALTQAPKILLDVFGHKSIEMTLYYILTDKDLQVEIEQVSRELRVIRAKEVVEQIVLRENLQKQGTRDVSLGSYGGPAAVMVEQAIQVQTHRLHRLGTEWGADSAVELAEILTLGGKAWQLVRPGVICTKFPGTESGPCNKSLGHPEPSRCQSDCGHRLEEAFLREDVDGSISEAVKAYVDAETKGNDLMQALWAGQIRTHVGRFTDLRDKWMADPTVRGVMLEKDDVPV